MPTAYALIPGAGGRAWYWHRVAPLLSARGAEAIAIDLPADDDSADLTTNADIVSDAVASKTRVAGPLVLVAQSMGAFTAPILASRLQTRGVTPQIVLVNPLAGLRPIPTGMLLVSLGASVRTG